MQAVKSRNTKPEKIVRKILSAAGYRFKLNRKDICGCPDIVFASRRRLIFIHGCFWHGHSCARGARTPKTNTAYWTAKIKRNRLRHLKVLRVLRKQKWSVLTIWECELKKDNLLQRLRNFLNGGKVGIHGGRKR
jgi:DNA mismatch endonuclease (patch repair protein)